jgi:hypothetical protein
MQSGIGSIRFRATGEAAAIHSLGLTEVAPARREADATLSVI